MKILLSIDSSFYSKVVEEVANGSFPLNTKVCMIPVYERTSNIFEPMGAPLEY
ncbi:hypothetical protein [Flavobacterium sp. ZB4P13]|uniref:hypothetical protein n=1 Tax=Flavobacterium sp. ZB4P13 TaxID=3401728 RepID=UPI003AAEDF1C